MRIGEFARRTGLTPSTVRFYEERDMFNPGQITRGPNGYRDFGEDAVQRVRLVLAGRDAGFSLQDMRTRMAHWVEMDDTERRDLLTEQLDVIERRREELERSRATILDALAVLEERRRPT
ncbi:MerR family transcriptional regulator [Brachybacterium sp. MASK1Z-5]|uniref:MerR family transcriptional regulator n=1 Tax=Brachybacterium halotolerans TaxID=2795215 RepID=A0ABS1BBV6_9MICO|nr:MerR family transcriptional regulator [Brachybacterium halotolerans]MBK0331647.1 MerR family transcriptional regulator [Brachybacterium halotolerans]